MRGLCLKTVAAAIVATGLISTPSSYAQDSTVATAVESNRDMIVTANPLATDAGLEILAAGGTAIDAMIAAQAVLGLVEPQSSGLGGGAFVVYYDADSDTVTTFDAREKAPSAATPERFMGMGFFDAWQTGLAVGVPGTPKLLETMYDVGGTLPKAVIYGRAKELATKGFELSERTSSQVTGLLGFDEVCQDRFFRDPTAFNYFAQADNCTAKPAGTFITNPDYAATLDVLIDDADGFYTGPIADAIVAAVQSDPKMPGDMTKADLENYEVIERPAVCADYRGFNVCGMGPPSSGAVAVGQILGIVETEDDLGTDPLGVDFIHLFSQAGRLAFVDRGLYLGDSDFVSVPVDGLLNKSYLAGRAGLIQPTDTKDFEPGTPPTAVAASGLGDTRTKNSGTSHISIVDRFGNALSMTTTIESSFGNGVMVKGFLLNNELTDFAFTPTDEDGSPRANRVEPNKRPRSSMSPTIVFDSNADVKYVTGSPGGSRIIAYTAQSIINMIDFGLDPQEAINVPHFMNRNSSTTDIEEPIDGVTLSYDATAVDEALTAIDHSVRIRSLTSGLSVIEVLEDKLIGGADQRRDGKAAGNSVADFPRLLTTPDRVAPGDYGWVQFEDGTKQWVDPACRAQLEGAGFPLDVETWDSISRYADGAVFSCDDIAALRDGSADGRVILVTPDRVAPGNYGWLRFEDGTKQWVDGDCRADLESDGLSVSVLEWVDIDEFPDTEYQSCDALRDSGGGSQITLLVTPDRVEPEGNYGWVLFSDDQKQWVDAACRGDLETAGVVVDIREWVDIEPFADRSERLACEAIIAQDNPADD